MRSRQDALTVLSVVGALAFLPGCGAMFHASQTVTWVSPPDAKVVVYQGGEPLKTSVPGTQTAPVFLNAAGGYVAAAPGKKVRRVTPERHVDGVAIACDALWSLTIIGVAAPISDAALGTFVKVSDRVEVHLESDTPTANPLPVYSLFGTTVTASADAPAAAPAAAAPAAP